MNKKKQKTREEVMLKTADNCLLLFQDAKLDYFEASSTLAFMEMVIRENWKIVYTNKELIKKAEIFKEKAKHTVVQ